MDIFFWKIESQCFFGLNHASFSESVEGVFVVGLGTVRFWPTQEHSLKKVKGNIKKSTNLEILLSKLEIGRKFSRKRSCFKE